ncbi:MAG: hypothetical protein ACR2GG_08280 [Gemmatimonadaceae bacterium]
MLPLDSLYFTIPIFLVSAYVVRKVFLNAMDPLLLTLFTLCSSIGLMAYYYADGAFADVSIVVTFAAAHVAFLVGLLSGNKVVPRRRYDIHFTFAPDFVALSCGVFFAVTVLVFVIMAQTVGLTILQENPDTAKNLIYTGGAGVFKRFVPSLVMFTILYSFAAQHERRITALSTTLLAIVPLGIAFVSGGKGSVFVIYTVLVYQWAFLARNKGVRVRISRYLAAGAAIGVTLAAALYIYAVGLANEYGLSGADVLTGARVLLLNRIVAYGDISMYYFTTGLPGVFVRSPASYVPDLLSDILGMLRLTPYRVPLGAELVTAVLGTSNEGGFGPNAQAYFVGVIYFGKLLGIVYSFGIGYLVASLRRIVQVRFSRTNFDMIAFVFANIMIVSIPVDFTFSLATTFTAFLAFIGVTAVGYVAYVAAVGRSPVAVVYIPLQPAPAAA